MIIAIDFDGTLTQKHSFPEFGEPRTWLVEKAIQWRKQGHTLILWTCREDVRKGENAQYKSRMYLTEALEWCKSYGLEFDAVNMNLVEVKYPGIKVSRKVYADLYIDDKSTIFNDYKKEAYIQTNDMNMSELNPIKL